MGTPVVILENEVSSAGVDNQLLRQEQFTVENVFAGCVCCTNSGDMCDAIQRIRERYEPRWLLLEATGMAYPDSIRTVIRQELDLDVSILALADAKRWDRLRRAMPEFIESQLVDAEAVLMNKVDLVSPDIADSISAQIRELNPRALLCPVCATEIQPPLFWRKMKSRRV